MTRREWIAAAFFVGQDQTPLFRASTRLVEVQATVQDSKRRYVGGLGRDDFSVLDGGAEQKIEDFESNSTGLTLALMLDLTGSMSREMSGLKKAVVSLLSRLRKEDRVGVFGFNQRLRRLQDFTPDLQRVENAVLSAEAGGGTALFDSLTRVSVELSREAGKKALIVFTDGDDNASGLTLPMALRRAQASGLPVHTVLQGEAKRERDLARMLAQMSRMTGGSSHVVTTGRDAQSVLEQISQEIHYTYLLTFKSEPGHGEWRRLEVRVKGHTDYIVRCREGYFAS